MSRRAGPLTVTRCGGDGAHDDLNHLSAAHRQQLC